MSQSRLGFLSGARRRGIAGLGGLALAALALSACDAGQALPGAAGTPSGDSSSASTGDSTTGSADAAGPVSIRPNVKRGASDVAVDKLVSVAATNGTLSNVEVTSKAGSIAGAMSDDGTSWTATDRLEPGTSYLVRSTATSADGTSVTKRSRFSTQDLTLDEQTYPSVAPLPDETVGVGMPVIVNFDVPVTDKKTFEKHMTVTSSPAQPGAWHWLSDTEAHYRPKAYWKAGTDVHVAVDVNSVPAGNGVFGQEDRDLDFHIGKANVYKVNAETHQMRVYTNGKLIRTIPITTGKPGFTTRSGTKVIIEKFEDKRMNSETVGITGSEAYDLDDVKYAMRLTYSGEFIHAAPWSVGSQGYANVSHGCTGMSTENAEWLFNMSKRGDVVEYTGTDRPMTFDNGYGDWNETFRQYKKGSALS